jgi:hypothetical protein
LKEVTAVFFNREELKMWYRSDPTDTFGGYKTKPAGSTRQWLQ